MDIPSVLSGSEKSVVKRKSVDDLFELPEEVLEEIFSQLSVRDIVACSEVSKPWRAGVNMNSVWRSHCRSENYDDNIVKKTHCHLFVNPSKIDSECDDISESGLEPLCYWREVYNWYKRLSKNWLERNFQKFKLAETNSPVYSLHCDGTTAVTGHENSTITAWSVEGLPYHIQSITAVLPEYPVISVRTTTKYIVAVQKKLVLIYRKNELYELVDLKSFELGEDNVEQKERLNALGANYSCWYKETLRMHEVSTALITPLIYAIIDDHLYISRYGTAVVRIWKLTDSELVSKKTGLRELSQIESVGSDVYFVITASVTHVLRYSLEEDEVKPMMSVAGRKKFVFGEKLVMALPAPGDTCLKRMSVWKKGDYTEPLGTKTINSSQFCAVIVEQKSVIYSEGSLVSVWNPFKGAMVRTFSVGSTVGFIRPGFCQTLIVFMHSSLHLWDWKAGKRLYRIYTALEWTGDYRHLIWITSCMLLSAGVNHQLEMLSFL